MQPQTQASHPLTSAKEKRDGAGEDPYNYYKNPRIFEGMF
jgi:hypothetical protein